MRFLPSFIMTAVLSCLPVPSGTCADRPADGVAALVKEIGAYDYGQGEASMRAVETFIRSADATGRKELEIALQCILSDTEAGPAAKLSACRILRNIGTETSVPVLSELLKDPEATPMALYALHHIPGDSAGKALSGALAEAQGLHKVAILAVLGERRDAGSLEVIFSLFKDADPAVAQAAYQAAAHIGGPRAAARLHKNRPAPELFAVWIDANLACADRLDREADQALAESIFEPFSDPPYPLHVRYAALRGLIRLGSSKATDQVLLALKGNDIAWRQAVAHVLIRNSDDEVLDAVTSAMPKLPPESRPGAISLLADCGYTKALPAIQGLLESEDEAVARAAIAALGTLGSVQSAEALLHAACGKNQAAAKLAFEALANLPDAKLDAWLIDRLASNHAMACEVAVQVLAARKSTEALPGLLALAKGRDDLPWMSLAQALGVLGDIRALPLLLEMIAAGRGEPYAERALGVICARSDKKDCTALVISAVEKAGGAALPVWLRQLRALGHPSGIPVVRKALEDPDGNVRRAALDVLAEWPDAIPAEDLWVLVNEGRTEAEKLVALRGYIRMIGLSSAGDEEKTACCRKAMAAGRTEEMRLVLSQVSAILSAGSFEIAASCLSHPELRAEAEVATLAIAGTAKDVRTAIPEKIRDAMHKIAETSKDTNRVHQAESVLKQL